MFLSGAAHQTVSAEPRLGKPLIHNFARHEFGAEVQHWDAIQDHRGVMYFANNAGVLEYDGLAWRLIELPSRLSVRSLAIAAGGKGPIYVGARGDFGYLGADPAGQLQFYSLLPPEAREDPSFDQVFTPTAAPSGGVYFQARTKLCRFDNGLHCRDTETDLHKVFSAAGGLYVQQDGIGLMRLVDDSMQPVPGGERFAEDEITVVLPHSDQAGERMLVGTRDFELFLQEDDAFVPVSTAANDRVGEDQLLDGTVLPDGSYALATRLRGLVIVDREGNVLQRIDQSTGLQDNHVHAVLSDRQGGLWAALQNGVSRVEVASPFSVFDEGSGLEREWREVVRHGNVLYVRGYKGLFAATLPAAGGSPTPRTSQPLRFARIPAIAPPASSFVIAQDRLLVSSFDGIHEMHGERARRILTYSSTPLILYRSRSEPSRVYVGLAEGVASIRMDDGAWRDEGRIDGVDETITSIAEGENGDLWLVSHRQRVIQVDFAGSPGHQPPNRKERRIRAYPLGSGVLTGRISIREIDGRPAFLTDSGIFEFDATSDRFVAFAGLAALTGAGRRSFSWIAEDPLGSLWIASRKPGGVDFLRKGPDGSYVLDNAGLRQTLAWSIYPEPQGSVVWLCTPDYLLRYDRSLQNPAPWEFTTLLRRVTARDTTVVYGGAPVTEATEGPAFPHRSNSLQFEFAAPRFGDARNEFQSYLEGFDADWSGWSAVPSRIYTNLPKGSYRFHVRARDVQGRVGQAVIFGFSILAPWYQTGWAYALYVVLLSGFLFLISKFERRRAQLRLQRQVEHLELEKLRELDRLKSRFFADISHEFRTPLTLILGPVGQMLDEATAPAIVQRLRLVRRNAQYLLRLISQLLDLSKVESGKMRLHATAGDLVHGLEAIVMPFAAVAEGHGIDLRFQPGAHAHPRERVEIYFDSDVLEKILNNLLGNAFKFTPPGGTVAVEVRSPAPVPDDEGGDGQFVEIVISDSGLGIPRDDLPRIFDRFYQVDGTRSREGIGIGLALVKELVELHYGQVHVESEEGKGTTFVIRLPKGKNHLKPDEIVGETPFRSQEPVQYGPPAVDIYVEEPAHATDPAEESEDETTVLIVEDHAEVRSFLREHLQKYYKVLEAQNGAEGFHRAVSSLPDLVLSDIMMQQMNGYELCRALKTHESTCHIPVVLLTAKATREDKLLGLDTGADCYLIKPFDALELLVQVRNLIEQRRRLRERFSGPVVLKPSEMCVAPMDEAFLTRVLTVVQNNLQDPEFDVERLGRDVGLSRSQLHRKLRALTNQSPTLMIRSIRLQRAAELLRQKTGSVAEIAYFVGFSSQAYFAKCFREQFGCSPKEYVLSVPPSPVQLGPAAEAPASDTAPSARAQSRRRDWPVHRRA